MSENSEFSLELQFSAESRLEFSCSSLALIDCHLAGKDLTEWESEINEEMRSINRRRLDSLAGNSSRIGSSFSALSSFIALFMGLNTRLWRVEGEDSFSGDSGWIPAALG